MCYPPFKTGMERILVIRQLRDAGRFPDDFEDREAGRAMKPIILKLVSKSPDMRLSAKDLLSSPLLPPKTDTDSKYLYEITTAISKSNANTDKIQIILDSIYKQSLYKNIATTNIHSSSLMNSSPPSAPNTAAAASTDEIFFDMKSLNRAYLNIQPKALQVVTSSSGGSGSIAVATNDSSSRSGNAATSIPATSSSRNVSAGRGMSKTIANSKHVTFMHTCLLTTAQLTASVCSRIEEVFKSHGAIHFSPTMLLPISKLSQIYSREALQQYTKYLDMNGNIFTLPNNLITGYTRYAALLHIENSKRYEVSLHIIFCYVYGD